MQLPAETCSSRSSPVARRPSSSSSSSPPGCSSHNPHVLHGEPSAFLPRRVYCLIPLPCFPLDRWFALCFHLANLANFQDPPPPHSAHRKHMPVFLSQPAQPRMGRSTGSRVSCAAASSPTPACCLKCPGCQLRTFTSNSAETQRQQNSHLVQLKKGGRVGAYCALLQMLLCI